MRCYYEELGLGRDSAEGDIKTAYRKLALRWHPDKNPDCLEEAKERFQLIQQAYEVLSDAQERAWYDNHREQILRGKNSEYSENCLDVFQYFTGSCYKGYGNDAQGFYSVYRDVFNNIASEDIEFMDGDDELRAPQFGNADSSYEDVVGPFYAYWLSYSTKKTYEWLCPYDVRDIKERFILRKVEKEMRKIVQNARKERNEEVRNLVSFVRKRDRRVLAYRRVLEERAEANRLKQEEKRKEQLRKRQEQLAAVRANKVVNDGYEEQLRQLEQQYGSDSDIYTDEDDEESDDVDEGSKTADSNEEQDEVESELEYVDDLYCVACNKSFKNAKARANHKESKKHRDNVERLRQQMETEEQEFNGHNDSLEATEESLADLNLNGNHETDPSDQLDLGSEDSAEKQPNKRSKKSKKSKKAAPKAVVESEDEEEEAVVQPVELNAAASNTEDEDDDDWSRGKKSAKKAKTRNKTTTGKQKIETEAKPPTENKSKPTAATIRDDEAASCGMQHTCVTCKLVFDSKNKLFAHLKKTNHGVYIPKSKPEVEGKPPGGKGKGRRK
ncbi:dnaJ homolog subfamily C member 21 [Drosophila innubila]|uniref:dnaJ homolog subfamily C member 21 n=1 Tax=Drosophila innubila TaxID=198719 RepID=UPI00148E76BA|nr:dnaJ homolog subfamily C member 21 [Drosophila innubila]